MDIGVPYRVQRGCGPIKGLSLSRMRAFPGFLALLMEKKTKELSSSHCLRERYRGLSGSCCKSTMPGRSVVGRDSSPEYSAQGGPPPDFIYLNIQTADSSSSLYPVISISESYRFRLNQSCDFV